MRNDGTVIESQSVKQEHAGEWVKCVECRSGSLGELAPFRQLKQQITTQKTWRTKVAVPATHTQSETHDEANTVEIESVLAYSYARKHSSAVEVKSTHDAERRTREWVFTEHPPFSPKHACARQLTFPHTLNLQTP